ncbi:hypothetical protein [Trichocoleus sp. FACHB-262]|uniref:hypothetical protein n=1 Tax=Trichocoleus sp. FACHB-262 TaxID=2692869 RepID=UPI001F55655E|nr:hypothetical protein [Trichocoleus sp. FACHB-262]
MPHCAYGPINRDRVKHLLGVLLSYADDELEGIERLHSDLKVNWQTEKKQLVVRTKLRTLEKLTEKDELFGKLTKEQIREAINHLKNYLKILIDNRESPRGAEDWHFTLELWSKDKEENLRRFDAEWQAKLPPKSKLLSSMSKESGNISAAPGADKALNEGSTSLPKPIESAGVIHQELLNDIDLQGDLEAGDLVQKAERGKSVTQVMVTKLKVEGNIKVANLTQES